MVLYRTSSCRGGFRLIITDPALDDLARKATAQAVRLDDQEAPKREVARLKKEQDDGRTACRKMHDSRTRRSFGHKRAKP